LAEKILDHINEQIPCLWKKEEEFEANHKKLVEFSQRKVKLDVGGKLFSTTLTMLTKEDCFFSAMFSGHWRRMMRMVPTMWIGILSILKPFWTI